MNIQQFHYVIAVGELHNFKLAAEKCFVTQSTLSTMVAKFEDEIGVTLFDRRTKPITTTKEGERIIQQLKVMMKEIDNLNEIVNDLKGELRGTLKIGVIPTVGPYLLPLFLNEFIAQFPKVHFEISEITTEKIVEHLIDRDIDIGIVSVPLNHPELDEIPMYNEPFLLFDAIQSEQNDRVHLSDINFDRMWLLEEGHCMRTQVERICDLHEACGVNRNLEYKSGTIDTLLKFVRRNDGITLLPMLATHEFSEADTLHLHRFDPPVPARAIGLVVHKHFVKKKILELLRLEIQDRVIPLLGRSEEQRVVAPV